MWAWSKLAMNAISAYIYQIDCYCIQILFRFKFTVS